MYNLVCIAPDGAKIVERDRFSPNGFDSIEAAWNQNESMGSKWIFYPIRIVTGASKSGRAKIVSLPHGMSDEWKGKTVDTLIKAIKNNQDEAISYLDGKAPFLILP